MRLDAMLGKTPVGMEHKIQEPSEIAARQNAENQSKPHQPYSIPAAELLGSSPRRFDGMYKEDVKITYYSNPRIFSKRTERDETMDPGVLYREIEED